MEIETVQTRPSRLLNPTSGFLTGYSHTLNPYVGCAFACSYCYVREMPVALFREKPWGSWVDVKSAADGRLEKEITLARKKGPVTVFMSSSTDPYQPAEYQYRVTRSLLEAMTRQPPDFLFVQTRSPLVLCDIELLRRLSERVIVSMTVETDLEQVRKAFAPASPPIAGRLRALRQLKSAGIPVQAAVAPMLPSSPEFPGKLAALVDRVCLDDYFRGDGSLGRRTERLRIKDIYSRHGWDSWYDPHMLDRVADRFRAVLPADRVFISREGFLPVIR